jgi:hypothetical protein
MTDRKRIGDTEFIKNTIMQMVEDGSSMKEIAEHLSNNGFPHTRNAVAGKIKRFRDKGKIPQTNRTAPPKAPEKVKPVRLNKKFIPDRTIKKENIQAKREKHNAVFAEDTTGIGVLFLEVTNDQCKWVMDYQRQGQKVCCGAPVYYRSFCKEHYYMCYEPITPRRTRITADIDKNTQEATKVMYKKFMKVFE